MALSNWDTMALNHKGEPINGIFTSPLGVTVEIYKNWLYVRDKKAWQGGAFVEPTIMQVTSGDFIYKDVHIVAIRGPQDGVFAVVWSWDKEHKEVLGMVGCGVSGFEGGKWIGVTKETLQWFQAALRREIPCTYEVVTYTHGADGTEHREVEQKEDEVPELDVPQCFKEIDLMEKALRFNQGDAYFADKLERGLPATAPGEAETPILLQVTEMMNKENKEKT